MVFDAGQQPEPTRFDFHRVVGRSGSSVVWEATQISTGRLVALKVLNVDLTDEETVRRFDRERHVMGMLSGHPNIVTIYDAGIYDQHPWLAMQFCSQGSLAGRIQHSGAFPIAEAVDVLVAIGVALTVAHQRGVLHCDIKPANILINDFGEPALGDFGISRLTVGSATRTVATGYSVDHAPPEVLNDERPTVAADIYSLGTTIWELICGRPPFRQNPDTPYASAIRRILLEPLPEPTVSGVPAELTSLLTRMAAKEPGERPATMEEVVEAARGIQSRLAAPAAVTPAPAPVTRTEPVTPAATGTATDSPNSYDEFANTQMRRTGQVPQAPAFLPPGGAPPPAVRADEDEHRSAFEDDASATRIRTDPNRTKAGSSGVGATINQFVRGHPRAVLAGASACLVLVLAGVAALVVTGGPTSVEGTYQISATQTKCTVNLPVTCKGTAPSTFTDSWRIADCEQNRCSIFSSKGAWDGALTLVQGGSTWTTSGALAEKALLNCPETRPRKVATDMQISLTVTDDKLAGTRKESTRPTECFVLYSYTYTLGGQRTESTG